MPPSPSLTPPEEVAAGFAAAASGSGEFVAAVGPTQVDILPPTPGTRTWNENDKQFLAGHAEWKARKEAANLAAFNAHTTAGGDPISLHRLYRRLNALTTNMHWSLTQLTHWSLTQFTPSMVTPMHWSSTHFTPEVNPWDTHRSHRRRRLRNSGVVPGLLPPQSQ